MLSIATVSVHFQKALVWLENQIGFMYKLKFSIVVVFILVFYIDVSVCTNMSTHFCKL